MKKLLLPTLFALIFMAGCELMPRNTLKDCRAQCQESGDPGACFGFCDCIHQNCQPLDKCLAQYEQPATSSAPPK